MPVTGPALRFLNTYFNNTIMRAEVLGLLNSTAQPSVDASHVDCVHEKDLDDFLHLVLPEGAVSAAQRQAWASLPANATAMGVATRGQRVSYYAVKHDTGNQCYYFVLSDIDFTGLGNATGFDHDANHTHVWTTNDHQDYKFQKPSKNDTVGWEEDSAFFLSYDAVAALQNAPRKSQYFHGNLIPASMLGAPLPGGASDGVFDDVVAFVEHIGSLLNANISAMGTPPVADATKLNTCLGFDYFNVKVDSSTVECVDTASTEAFVMQVFEEVFWAYNDTEALKRELAELDYGQNVTWALQRLAFSADNTTYPGYAQVYKRKDATRDCSNWCISFIEGVAKIAPDMYVEKTEKSYAWGLFSDTEVNIVYEPHKVTPDDALALELFFHAINQNGICAVTGADAFITMFPNLDC